MIRDGALHSVQQHPTPNPGTRIPIHSKPLPKIASRCRTGMMIEVSLLPLASGSVLVALTW